jgi:hypothetical protein
MEWKLKCSLTNIKQKSSFIGKTKICLEGVLTINWFSNIQKCFFFTVTGFVAHKGRQVTQLGEDG